jgi:8-oxo-dGTP pyrophosphatase MutT (NUDIX family)
LSALLLNNLKNRLAIELPGMEAHRQLAPVHRVLKNPVDLLPGEYKPSAVMILLYRNAEGDWMFPLIQRLAYDGVHGGQMALPGGKQEKTDLNLQQTALRECVEEIGVQGEIQFLGKLSPLFIPVSEYLVQPYVSYLEQDEPVFKAQVTEVEAVYSVKLRELLNDQNLNQGSIKVKDYSLLTPYFLLESKQVWGATAMILNEMRTLLKPIF